MQKSVGEIGLESEMRLGRWAEARNSPAMGRNVGQDSLQMDVAPWGEGHLQLNGREIARIDGRQRQKPSLSQP
jgi:hypothetical protein